MTEAQTGRSYVFARALRLPVEGGVRATLAAVAHGGPSIGSPRRVLTGITAR